MADTRVTHTGHDGLLALRLVDSVAELTPADAGCVAVTASHGGLSAGRYALAVGPALTVFNDAGVGLREAGVAALPLMQAAGMAACTVAHTSACIGQANSTWDTWSVSPTRPHSPGACAQGKPCKANWPTG